MNGNSLMERVNFHLQEVKMMPTENINKQNQLLKVEYEEYFFLSDNEPPLTDMNNNDYVSGTRKM